MPLGGPHSSGFDEDEKEDHNYDDNENDEHDVDVYDDNKNFMFLADVPVGSKVLSFYFIDRHAMNQRKVMCDYARMVDIAQ